MAEETKPITPGVVTDVKPISVHLSISPDRLPAAVSAVLSVAGSACITVRGGAVEIEKAIKSISSSGPDVRSAFLSVVGKPKLD